MTSPQGLLKKYDIRPSKNRGQNFLINPDIAKAIIEKAGFGAEDIVIEVGTGLGILTLPLAAGVKKLISFEVDPRLIAIVKEEYAIPSTLEIVHQDILKVDFQALEREYGQKLKIIGNLPYYISSPILFKIWECRSSFKNAFVMLQKEVAERIVAPPGGKTYGILAVFFNYCAAIEKILKVPATQFYPRPEVDSMVLGFHLRPPEVIAEDESLFKKTVKIAFQKRRKTLQNALAGTGFPSELIRNVLETLCIDGQRRAETLGVNDFVRISNLLRKAAIIC
ncbi:MAG: 16S rRNA (adenine(1518)-N(6)/adenine(1519)-N(6))-dimethyltransferase RsmA [Deltaproteobacteria bacterium]|nr:16S rRNA (adenine(1518)-N(6)/adenine(1519)-N(6))-dimethyltransferase RsmA [Deltaproteobacteria bacterium]